MVTKEFLSFINKSPTVTFSSQTESNQFIQMILRGLKNFDTESDSSVSLCVKTHVSHGPLVNVASDPGVPVGLGW